MAESSVRHSSVSPYPDHRLRRRGRRTRFQGAEVNHLVEGVRVDLLRVLRPIIIPLFHHGAR